MPRNLPRPTFSLAALLVVFLLVTLVVRWLVLLQVLVPILPLAVIAKLSSKTWGALAARYGVLMAAVYVPATPGFFLDCSHCREMWWQTFFLVPGVGAAIWCRPLLADLPSWGVFGLAALFVGTAIGLLYAIGAHCKLRLAVAATIGAIGSAYSALIYAADLAM